MIGFLMRYVGFFYIELPNNKIEITDKIIFISLHQTLIVANFLASIQPILTPLPYILCSFRSKIMVFIFTLFTLTMALFSAVYPAV